MTPLAITGMGLWDSIGQDPASNLDLILCHKHRRPQKKLHKNLLGFGLAPSKLDLASFQKDRFHKIPSPWFNIVGAWVMDRAVAQAGLIKDLARVGVIAGSLFGDVDSEIKTFTDFQSGRSRSGPRDFFCTINDTLASMVARIFQTGGPSTSMVASCASGIYAIELSRALIGQGMLDQVLIINQDLCTDAYSTHRMNGVGAFSKANLCRPFDQARDGIVFGDASAALVVESEASALGRGAGVLAKILGTGSCTHYSHRTSPIEAKSAYYQSFDAVVQSSGINPAEIDWISGHATGTIDGDKIENDAMSDLLPGKTMTSFKGHIGHTMSACGLAEIIYTVESMRRGIIPHIGNLEQDNLETTLRFAYDNVPLTGPTVLKSSHGFGGRSANIILRGVH